MSGRRRNESSSGGTALARPETNGAPPAAAQGPPPGERLKRLLAASHDKMLAVLPKHLTAEKITQVVSTLVFKTPKLQECNELSIVSSVLEACELGLELSPKMCEAYLVPFWDSKRSETVCQLQIGYQGLQKLARQSNDIAYIHARIVHARDVFVVEFSPDLEFHHSPHFGPDRGAVTHVYAVAKLRTGDHVLEVMTVDEIEAIHQRSQSYQTAAKKGWKESGPWVTDWNEMGRKTVLKRLCKALPRSVELARAIELDNEGYVEGVTVVSSPPHAHAPGLSRSQRLAHQLAGPEPEFREGTSGQIASEYEPPELPADDEGDEPPDLFTGGDDDIEGTEAGARG